MQIVSIESTLETIALVFTQREPSLTEIKTLLKYARGFLRFCYPFAGSLVPLSSRSFNLPSLSDGTSTPLFWNCCARGKILPQAFSTSVRSSRAMTLSSQVSRSILPSMNPILRYRSPKLVSSLLKAAASVVSQCASQYDYVWMTYMTSYQWIQ